MGPNDTFSMKMVGGMLLRWGTEEQKRRFLPRILSGEHRWCQGYSEPDSGSDLAGLRTQAVRDGDEWVLHGSEDLADPRPRGELDLRAGAHRSGGEQAQGSTFLLVPMDQPGVEVRPIRMIGGSPDFNAVFLDGARTSAANVVGDVERRLGGGQQRARLWSAATKPPPTRSSSAPSSTASSRWPAISDGSTIRSSATASPTPTSGSRRCGILGYRILTGVLSTGKHRAGGVDLQAALVGVPPRRHPAGDRRARRAGDGARRPAAGARLPRRRSGRAELDRVVGRCAVQRCRRHDLRRHVADPTQHPRRTCARPSRD